MFQTKVVKKIVAHFIRSVTFFYENGAVYGIIRKNTLEPEKPHNNITRYRCTVCWITKARDTHAEYVILIVFLLQQWLHKRTSVLRYTYLGTLPVFLLSSNIPTQIPSS